MRTGTRERLAGKEEWSMKIFRKLLLALLVLAALRVPCFAQEAFHGAYLQGFPDGSIRPEKQVTRAELAEILYRMISPDARQELTAESAFRDVGRNHWAYEAVRTMAGLRLMLGDTDGNFRPNDGVTGEELSIILERVRAQAKEYGHNNRREMSYLVTHSVLHLLGYDHLDEGPMKRQMREREEAIMSLLGLER